MTSVLGLDEPADRRALPPGRAPRPALEGQPARARATSSSRARRAALAQLEPIATELGAGAGHPAGRRRRVPLAPDEAGRRPARRGPRRRADRSRPRIPVYSNVDASPHAEPDDLRRTLVAQVIGGVRWEESMRRMLADGFDTFYEIGPGRVLTGLLKRIDRKIPCTSVPAR